MLHRPPALASLLRYLITMHFPGSQIHQVRISRGGALQFILWTCSLDLHVHLLVAIAYYGLPWWPSGKASTCNVGDEGLIPGSGRSPGKGNGNTFQYFLPGQSCGQRSLAGYRAWDRKRVTHDLATEHNTTNPLLCDDSIPGWRCHCWQDPPQPSLKDTFWLSSLNAGVWQRLPYNARLLYDYRGR